MLKKFLITSSLIICFNAFATNPILNPNFFNSDDKTFKDILIKNSITLENWVDSINKVNAGFYCLGETHYESFRNFISNELFKNLKMDTLFLEDTPKTVEELLVKNTTTGEAEIAGINIGNVFNSVLAKNPNVKIIGVDETEEQESSQRLYEQKQKRKFYSRDGFIAQNITESLKQNRVHFALYGSNHCSKNGLGLGGVRTFFNQLLNQKKHIVPLKSILLVKNERGNYYSDYLWLLGLNKKTFVIPDTSKISGASYNQNWKLKKFFDNYDTIIFFK